jgi:hypothetical protein
MTSVPANRVRRILRAVIAALLGLATVLVGLELGLRFLLFSDSAVARRLGAPWRKAGRYADPGSEDAYWQLQFLFADASRRIDRPHGADRELGWTGEIDAQTWMPKDPVDLRGRRPVLLYGDSYAACNTPPGHCFQDLLESSPLADRYCLVNYGVGGYGIDQEYLLLRRSIDLWKDRDPVVVLSFLVDDDFSRDLLSFRAWPKPRFRVEDGRLVAEPVANLDANACASPDRISIRSYLARFLIFRPGALPAGWQARLRASLDRRDEAIAVGRKLLEEMHELLEDRGLTHFFLVFHGREGLEPRPRTQWAEDLVAETTARLGVPTIGTRPFLVAAADGSRELAQQRFIGGTERTAGHYNEIGNIVAFEALRQGIEGRFGPADVSRVEGLLHRFPYEDPSRKEGMTILGCAAVPTGSDPTSVVRFSRTPYRPFDLAARKGYLLLEPGSSGRAGIRFALLERDRRLLGTAITVAARKDGTVEDGSLSVSILLDGREVRRSDVPLWPKGIDLDVDLAGSRELEIDAEAKAGRAVPAWVHIEGFRFE